MDIRSIARALGGDVIGRRQALCPGPRHSQKDRSLSVTIGASGQLIVHSHCGDDWRDCMDHANARLGIRREITKRPAGGANNPAGLGGKSGKTEADIVNVDNINVDKERRPERPTGNSAQAGLRTLQKHAVEGVDDPDDAERTRRALRIWNAGRDPRGTLVETYLHSRGLDLPDDAAGEAIRFDPACPFTGSRTPAMICLVRHIISNEPKAIHRTALDRDGRKIEIAGKSRAALGPIAGGAIKLTPDEDVTFAIGNAEGVETALSMRKVKDLEALSIWALISAGGLAAFPVLNGIESLWVAVDHDEAGKRASEAVKSRWLDAGREVLFVEPRRAKEDLNDLVGGHDD